MTPLLLLASLPALAGDLTVDWTAGPQTFHLEALLGTPQGYRLYGTNNIDARVVVTGMVVELSCTGTPSARGTDVGCIIGSVDLGGTAFQGEEDKLEAILAEYDQKLVGARIDIDFGADGRVRTVDLEGLGKGQSRDAQIQEGLRQLFRRVISVFDWQLPKKGEDPGKIWKYSGLPLLFELPSRSGTSGATVLKLHTLAPEGADLRIDSEGRGSVADQDQIEYAGSAGVSVVGGGSLWLDPATHGIRYAEQSMNGILTQAIQSGAGTAYYAMDAWVVRTSEAGVQDLPASVLVKRGG